ncbi:hypothetical protein K439DRAFT_1621872 [Ramaria rubella]|nr:hypothetical protein K439DRAFT_1621872 [Ramaria rubella]
MPNGVPVHSMATFLASIFTSCTQNDMKDAYAAIAHDKHKMQTPAQHEWLWIRSAASTELSVPQERGRGCFMLQEDILQKICFRQFYMHYENTHMLASTILFLFQALIYSHNGICNSLISQLGTGTFGKRLYGHMLSILSGISEHLGRHLPVRSHFVEKFMSALEQRCHQRRGVKNADIQSHDIVMVWDERTSSLLSSLKLAVLQKLQVYMAPAMYVVLNRSPLTSSGKLHRKALVEFFEAHNQDIRNFNRKLQIFASAGSTNARRTRPQSRIMKLWQAVLGTRKTLT